MQRARLRSTICLEHQLPEDEPSPLGMVCRECLHVVETRYDAERCISFWESQPMAYTLAGEPCFVFTIIWDEQRIRSLHIPQPQFTTIS